MDDLAIEFDDVRFGYPGGGGDTVRGLNLRVRRGEAVLVTGRTGCGKSTLLKMLNGIIPLESSGAFAGTVRINGVDTAGSEIPRLAQEAGLVFQTPDEQLFCNTVYEEVAFGPENVGIPREEIERRVDESLRLVGLPGFRERVSARLSGGQKQRVAIASQLSLEPRILALDEPVSQLDPGGAAEVIDCLINLKHSGITIIIVEHRIPEVLPLVDRIVVMDNGAIVSEFDKRELPRHAGSFTRLGLKLPDDIRICHRLNLDITKDWKSRVADVVKDRGRRPPDARPVQKESAMPGAGPPEPVLKLENVSFSYKAGDAFRLRDVSLDINRGDVIALMGHNGCGKSSLLSLLAGLNRPSAGSIAPAGNGSNTRGRRNKNYKLFQLTGMVFQNPDLQLFEDTLDREIAFGFERSPGKNRDIKTMVDETRRMLGLDEYGAVPPLALSKGQRLRAAVAATLSVRPSVLLLDEPTTGQNKENITNLIRTIEKNSAVDAVVFSTHDVDTAAAFAGRIVLMKNGRVIADGAPGDVLCDTALLKETGVMPTSAHEISRQCGLELPCLTFREFMQYCGCDE